MYRLHIDLPLDEDLENSQQLSEHIIEILKNELYGEGLSVVQYRLSNDTDRGNKNYLDINENGHCSNKKLSFEINHAI